MPDTPQNSPTPIEPTAGQPSAPQTAPPQAAPTDAMTIAQRDALVGRLQAAWRNLPTDVQNQIRPLLDDGHQQLINLVQNNQAPEHHTQMTLRLKALISNDVEGHLAALGHPLNLAATQPLSAPVPPQAIELGVGPDGSIIGTGQYQQLDPRWELVAGVIWLEHLLFKHPFPPGAPDSPEPIPDGISIALLSDWGTGNFGAGDAPAIKIAKFLGKNPADYTIHLGDVYYAGLCDEESNNFLNLWPKGKLFSFALNSNHDMYSGGGPYFDQVVGGSIFNKLQSPWSFFALENPHWMIIGLDSAYFSSGLQLYLNGTIGQNNAQTTFLRTMAEKAANDKRQVILLTHHNPISLADATSQNQLYTEVMSAFEGLPAPAYWYFGHEHVAAVYPPTPDKGIRFRCLGHGGLPYGQSSTLGDGQIAGTVTWYENRLVNDPTDPLRVYNGFVLLTLNGATVTENFIDETGATVWTSEADGNRK